jgi:hypothetical protein
MSGPGEVFIPPTHETESDSNYAVFEALDTLSNDLAVFTNKMETTFTPISITKGTLEFYAAATICGGGAAAAAIF